MIDSKHARRPPHGTTMSTIKCPGFIDLGREAMIRGNYQTILFDSLAEKSDVD